MLSNAMKRKKVEVDFTRKKAVQFGYWATPRLEMAYPRVTKSIPVQLECGHYRVDPLNDDEGMEIEKHVLVLRDVTPELYDVFMATYVYRQPIRTERDKFGAIVRVGICDTFDISKTEYHSRLNTALTSLKLMMRCGKCYLTA